MITPRQPEMSLKEIVKKPVSEWKNRMKNDFEVPIFKNIPNFVPSKKNYTNKGQCMPPCRARDQLYLVCLKSRPNSKIFSRIVLYGQMPIVEINNSLIMHIKYSILIAFFFIALNAVSQQILLPERIRSFGPVAVQKPVFLDSTDLKNAPFSDETLLSYFVSAPPHEKFSTALVPDTAGFFHLQKPEKGYAFQLISFFIDADRYGKAKLTVTSPHPLELWINDVKRATKTQVNDSLHLSGSVDATLNGFVNKSRIVIKMLTSSDYSVDPAVKIELNPTKKTPLPNTHFPIPISEELP